MYVNNVAERFDALSTNAHGSLGLFNGILTACVTTGSLLGLLLSSVLMRRGVSMKVLYTTLLALLAAGNALLLALPTYRPLPKDNDEEQAEQETPEESGGSGGGSGLLSSVGAIPLLIWRSRPAKQMAMFFLGTSYLTQGFVTGAFVTDAVSVSLGQASM